MVVTVTGIHAVMLGDVQIDGGRSVGDSSAPAPAADADADAELPSSGLCPTRFNLTHPFTHTNFHMSG